MGVSSVARFGILGMREPQHVERVTVLAPRFFVCVNHVFIINTVLEQELFCVEL